MAHQDHQAASKSVIANAVSQIHSPIAAGKPGLAEGSSIERFQMPATALDAHVLGQHCISISLNKVPVNYGGRLNGKQYVSAMRPDTVWFRAAGDSATCWWDRTMDGLFLSFDHNLIERTMGDEYHLQNLELVSTLQSKPDPALSHLITALHLDTAEGHPYGALRGEAILSATVALLVTGYGSKAHHIPSNKKNSPTVRRTVEYIADHLGSQLRMTAIAAEMGISPSHLHRSFRDAMGTTLWSYVLQQRVKEAQKLIRTSPASLLQISLSTGFESYSQFVASFRRETGVTPSEFRKAMRTSVTWSAGDRP